MSEAGAGVFKEADPHATHGEYDRRSDFMDAPRMADFRRSREVGFVR